MRNKDEKTPLHLLLEKYDEKSDKYQDEIIKYFISKKANINAVDARNYSVFDYTLINDNLNAANLILNLKNELKNSSLINKFNIALNYGSIKVARLLIETLNGNDLKSNMLTSSHTMILHSICKFRFYLDEEKSKNLINLMKLLFEKINTTNNYDEFLKAKDAYDFMPIHLAIRNGNLQLTEFLIEKSKAQLNFTGGLYGNSLIHFAAQNGSLLMLDLLIKHKADVKAINSRYKIYYFFIL